MTLDLIETLKTSIYEPNSPTTGKYIPYTYFFKIIDINNPNFKRYKL